MAIAKRIGIRMKIIVKNTPTSGLAVVKARIIWVNIMNPLLRYRRPAKTPIPLKNPLKGVGLFQIKRAKPMTKVTSSGARIKSKDCPSH